MSDFRVQMKSWLEKKREADALADVDDTDEETLRTSYGLVDAELEKLMLVLDEEPEEDEDDSEADELLSLYKQADPARYIQLSVEEKPLDGVEAELNAAMQMSDSGKLPIGLLLPRHQMIPDDEQLADVVTAITTETTVNTSPIAARIFKATAAGLMGFQMPTVQSGKQRYPYMTGGTTASVVARGTSVDAAAATIAVVDITPVALQASYVLDRDTILQNGAEVRTLLESDLRDVMGDALDDEILAGDGASPTRRKGLFPFISTASPSTGNDDTATSWAEAEAIAAEFVDGKHFMEDTGARMLIGPDTYKYLRKLYQASVNRPNALASIRADGVTVFVRDRVPAKVAKSGSRGEYQDSIYASQRGAQRVVIPVWNDMDLLVDPYSSGRKRSVELTFFMYFGLGYRETAVSGTTGDIAGVKKLRWTISAKS